MFKLYELIEKFKKELFNLIIVDDDVKLENFDVTEDFDEEKVVHETDMFSKFSNLSFMLIDFI